MPAQEDDNVSAAVIDLGVKGKGIGRPDHCDVVVDMDYWIVDTLFELGCTRGGEALYQGVEMELEGLTVTDERRHSTGEELVAYEGVVALSDAIEERLEWSENRMFLGWGRMVWGAGLKR